MIDERKFAQLNVALQAAGWQLRYPPTPDLAARFLREAQVSRRRQPRLAWALAALLAVILSLLAVPEVRARVLEFLQIGAVRIILPQPTETESSGAIIPADRTATPTFSPHQVLSSILDLDGETTLAAARTAVDFPIGLPSYPSDLGEPDKVYLQDTEDGKFVVLAWLDEQGQPDLVLYVVGPGVSITKGPPDVAERVEVNGSPAVWAIGDDVLVVNGSRQPVRFVHGPALIWEENGLTYRLEALLSLDEMIRVAESLNGQ